MGYGALLNFCLLEHTICFLFLWDCKGKFWCILNCHVPHNFGNCGSRLWVNLKLKRFEGLVQTTTCTILDLHPGELLARVLISLNLYNRGGTCKVFPFIIVYLSSCMVSFVFTQLFNVLLCGLSGVKDLWKYKMFCTGCPAFVCFNNLKICSQL